MRASERLVNQLWALARADAVRFVTEDLQSAEGRLRLWRNRVYQLREKEQTLDGTAKRTRSSSANGQLAAVALRRKDVAESTSPDFPREWLVASAAVGTRRAPQACARLTLTSVVSKIIFLIWGVLASPHARTSSIGRRP